MASLKLIFGGTFDPLHNGHLQLLLHLYQLLGTPISLLPLGGIPSYKAPPQASLAQRLEMLHLIAAQYPEQIEIDTSEALAPSYTPTYLSLQRLRQTHGSAAQLYFILGGDSLVSLDSWDHWRELFTLSNFIVALRPNYSLEQMTPQLKQQVLPRLVPFPATEVAGQIILTTFKPLAVSSTQIRHHCAQGLNPSAMVNPEIARYILTHNLYKEPKC